MTQIIMRLIFVFLILSTLNLEAQDTITSTNAVNVNIPVELNYGKGEFKNLNLPFESNAIENLNLEISIKKNSWSSLLEQKTVRVEIEQIKEGKIERFEIARFFLPWVKNESEMQQLFIFDISEYKSLFHDSTTLFVESNCKNKRLEFNFHFQWKTGKAPAVVNDIINLWRSELILDKGKHTKEEVDAKLIFVPKEVRYAQIKIYLSGQGELNSKPDVVNNSKFYFLSINDQVYAKRAIWRDDCGLNSNFPQEGPWAYSRRNWCPGQELRVFNHFFPIGQDTTLSIQLQLQGLLIAEEWPADYLLSANLILYEEASFINDAALVEILAPNKSRVHNRYNPICGSPVIRIRNSGSDTLRSLMLDYGFDNMKDNRYRWRGELAFMEEEIVFLPPLNWYFHKHPLPSEFCVSVETVNEKPDEYISNNNSTTTIYLAPVFPNQIRVEFRTNDKASENILELVDEMGMPLFEANDFVNDSSYSFDLDLSPGCYEFIIYDQEGDGIIGSGNKPGALKISESISGKGLIIFQADFGSEARQQFMILKSAKHE